MTVVTITGKFGGREAEVHRNDDGRVWTNEAGGAALRGAAGVSPIRARMPMGDVIDGKLDGTLEEFVAACLAVLDYAPAPTIDGAPELYDDVS